MRKSHDQCCGCEACRDICPQSAITMAEDGAGFRHPVIDPTACTGCGACSEICSRAETVLRAPLKGYAAAAKDSAIIRRSSSGGVFPLLAENCLSRGGRVYGAVSSWEDGYEVMHIGIDDQSMLPQLQGSKYVQSRMNGCFRHVREDLKAGMPVLFSGTPCQIAGLRAFLGTDFTNLLTVDIVCHGVASGRMFRDYLTGFPAEITALTFRDKALGWLDYYLRLTLRNGKTNRIHWKQSSFYSEFLRGSICRESCGQCPYARLERPGDLTLGDYWGFGKAHPEADDSWKARRRTGISCVLVNSEQGQRALEEISGSLSLLESTPEKIASGSGSFRPRAREVSLLEQYRTHGYSAVEAAFRGSRRPADVLADRLRSTIKLFACRMGGRL